MKLKIKKITMLVLLCLGLVLIYRFMFSYTILGWGERYKHKISTVEIFPFCFINPFYKDELIKSIDNFLNEDFKEYYQKEYTNTTSFSKRYFQDLDKGFRKTGFAIISIRETDKSGIIEILVFQYIKDDYVSVIFIFDIKAKKVIGFY
jgi:hypothetical protein